MSIDDRTLELLQRIGADDREALGELYQLHRERLWRMLFVRLDVRLAGRVSVEDVLQEAFLDVAHRIDEYLEQRKVPFYVWLRFLVLQRLGMIQRAHLGAACRDAGLEMVVTGPVSAGSMAGQFVGHLTSPSQAAMRRELQERLQAALAEMAPLDREVLALRHFEEMNNDEVAQALGISYDAASKRHVRALVRLREVLGEQGMP